MDDIEHFEKFTQLRLATISNKDYMVDRVLEIYRDLMLVTAIPSTEEIARLINNENLSVIDMLGNDEVCYELYHEEYFNKMDFHVETVLTEVGYPHIAGSYPSRRPKILQQEILTAHDLRKGLRF